MGIESNITHGRGLEDAVRRKEAQQLQEMLKDSKSKQIIEALKSGEMIQEVVNSSSSWHSDDSGSPGGYESSQSTRYRIGGQSTLYREDLEKVAKLVGRQIVMEEDAEIAAKELAAETAPIRLKVWADFVGQSYAPATLFEEEGAADVLFARAALEVPDKAKWKKATYSYSVTPLQFPEDTKQNLSDLNGVQFKKTRKYDKQMPGQFDEFLKKLQNPNDVPLLAIVGNRRHLIDPCLEKIKQREAAHVLMRHPELFNES